jgi:hypothetical protein
MSALGCSLRNSRSIHACLGANRATLTPVGEPDSLEEEQFTQEMAGNGETWRESFDVR